MHLHKWSRWLDGTAVSSSPVFPRLGTWSNTVQIRTCERCGKKKLRLVA